MRLADAAEILRYHGACMQDAPPDFGLLATLEAPNTISPRQPDFLLDLSGRNLTVPLPPWQEVHGSYLVQRQNALLFGSNNLVTREGYWCTESRRFKPQYLQYLQRPFYNNLYPGVRPDFEMQAANFGFDVRRLAQSQSARLIEEPIFLATPIEAIIWGRWISTVIPKIKQYLQYGGGRKLFCHVQHDWQQEALALLGVKPEQIIPHDPGCSYICRDVMTVEYSDADLQMSQEEQNICAELVLKYRVPCKTPKRLFVSRLTRSRKAPGYRTLQNEMALAERLSAAGFTVIEPENLPMGAQILMFAQAKQIVFIGGSAIFNAAFCAPDAKLVTIESSDTFIKSHAGFFASRNLAYGVVFGRQNQTEPGNVHAGWQLDVEPALDAISNYLACPPVSAGYHFDA